MFLAVFPGVLERLGASGERLGSVLERPGSVLGRLGAVLVAFKVVLDVKMSFDSVQNARTSKSISFCKVFARGPAGPEAGRLPRAPRLGGFRRV